MEEHWYDPVLLSTIVVLLVLAVSVFRSFFDKEQTVWATIDPVTKLYNRRRLEQLISREIENALHSQIPFSIAFVDIDDFKETKKRHGDAAGNGALAELADLFQEEIRRGAYIGRWDGDQFMIIYPGTEASKAVSRAERLRIEINRYFFKDVGIISASFGICEYSEGDTTLEKLLFRADTALAQAKKNGKNQVVLSS